MKLYTTIGKSLNNYKMARCSGGLFEGYICILHRYPLADALATNASITDFLLRMKELGFRLRYISLKSSDHSHESVFARNLVTYELPIEIQRSNFLLKMIQSSFYYLFLTIMGIALKMDDDLKLVYCDDSIPFLGFLMKIVTGKKVIIRLGDLQTGYLLQESRLKVLFRIVHSFERYTWKMMDGLIPISHAFSSYLMNAGIAKEKIIIVPESVDTGTFRPRYEEGHSSKDKSQIKLMYHGVLEPTKGLDVLLSYFGTSDFPTNTKLLIVGDGSMRNQLQRRFADLVRNGQLEFLGWKPLASISRIINDIDIGLVFRRPSLANQMIATAGMLQYLACGKPVIAPNLGSMRDLIIAGKCGLLYDFRSPADFHKALEQLANNGDLRERLGTNGRMLVEREYSKEIVGHRLVDALIKLGR